MPGAYPAQDLSCPDPSACPVADPGRFDAAPLATIEAGRRLYRVYRAYYGYGVYNPAGDSRFSPFDSETTGARVASYYVAENATGALLESVFHEVAPGIGDVILVDTLRERLLVHVAPVAELTLVDLRDPVLASLGVARSAVASSGPEHYPCTRRIARHLEPRAQGLLWNSRQAELHRAAGRRVLPSEVAVVFADVGDPAPGWQLVGPSAISLTVDRGRTWVDQIAEELDVVVIDD